MAVHNVQSRSRPAIRALARLDHSSSQVPMSTGLRLPKELPCLQPMTKKADRLYPQVSLWYLVGRVEILTVDDDHQSAHRPVASPGPDIALHIAGATKISMLRGSPVGPCRGSVAVQEGGGRRNATDQTGFERLHAPTCRVY